MRYECAVEWGDTPPKDDEYPQTVDADDGSEAAEAAAEITNREECEYPYEQAVWVRNTHTGEVARYTVYLEMAPNYHAVRA